jgi:hypothetical protein
MTAAYRVKFADTLSDANLDEFTLTGVSLEARISAAGAMSGAIPLARGDRSLARRLATIKSAGGSAVYVYRNGALWWDGLLWTKEPSSDENGKPAVTMSAGTPESYLDRVRLLTDLPALTSVDQLAIARSFIDHLQADPYADLNITYDPAVVSGIIRDRVIYQAAARPSYGQMLGDLAGLDQGFEYRISTITDPVTDARTRRLRLGYPIITSAVVHDLAKPGAILSYRFSEDGSRGGTYLVAQGSSVSSDLHTDTTALALGYPRLDATTNYSAITDVATLNAHAAADLARARVPVLVPQVRIRLDGAPDISPAALGDSVRLSIEADEYFPDDTVLTYRLVGLTVNPPERGVPETADLVLN